MIISKDTFYRAAGLLPPDEFFLKIRGKQVRDFFSNYNVFLNSDLKFAAMLVNPKVRMGQTTSAVMDLIYNIYLGRESVLICEDCWSVEYSSQLFSILYKKISRKIHMENIYHTKKERIISKYSLLNGRLPIIWDIYEPIFDFYTSEPNDYKEFFQRG